MEREKVAERPAVAASVKPLRQSHDSESSEEVRSSSSSFPPSPRSALPLHLLAANAASTAANGGDAASRAHHLRNQLRYFGSLPQPPQPVPAAAKNGGGGSMDSDEEWARIRRGADDKKRELNAFFASQAFTVPAAYYGETPLSPASFASRLAALRNPNAATRGGGVTSGLTNFGGGGGVTFGSVGVHPPPPAHSTRCERTTRTARDSKSAAEKDFFDGFASTSGGCVCASRNTCACTGDRKAGACGNEMVTPSSGDDAWLYDLLSNDLRAKIRSYGAAANGCASGTNTNPAACSGAFIPPKLTAEQKYHLFAGLDDVTVQNLKQILNPMNVQHRVLWREYVLWWEARQREAAETDRRRRKEQSDAAAASKLRRSSSAKRRPIRRRTETVSTRLTASTTRSRTPAGTGAAPPLPPPPLAPVPLTNAEQLARHQRIMDAAAAAASAAITAANERERDRRSTAATSRERRRPKAASNGAANTIRIQLQPPKRDGSGSAPPQPAAVRTTTTATITPANGHVSSRQSPSKHRSTVPPPPPPAPPSQPVAGAPLTVPPGTTLHVHTHIHPSATNPQPALPQQYAQSGYGSSDSMGTVTATASVSNGFPPHSQHSAVPPQSHPQHYAQQHRPQHHHAQYHAHSHVPSTPPAATYQSMDQLYDYSPQSAVDASGAPVAVPAPAPAPAPAPRHPRQPSNRHHSHRHSKRSSASSASSAAGSASASSCSSATSSALSSPRHPPAAAAPLPPPMTVHMLLTDPEFARLVWPAIAGSQPQQPQYQPQPQQSPTSPDPDPTPQVPSAFRRESPFAAAVAGLDNEPISSAATRHGALAQSAPAPAPVATPRKLRHAASVIRSSTLIAGAPFRSDADRDRLLYLSSQPAFSDAATAAAGANRSPVPLFENLRPDSEEFAILRDVMTAAASNRTPDLVLERVLKAYQPQWHAASTASGGVTSAFLFHAAEADALLERAKTGFTAYDASPERLVLATGIDERRSGVAPAVAVAAVDSKTASNTSAQPRVTCHILLCRIDIPNAEEAGDGRTGEWHPSPLYHSQLTIDAFLDTGATPPASVAVAAATADTKPADVKAVAAEAPSIRSAPAVLDGLKRRGYKAIALATPAAAAAGAGGSRRRSVPTVDASQQWSTASIRHYISLDPVRCIPCYLIEFSFHTPSQP